MDGRTLAYTARAGLLPIVHNETGEVRGDVFFTHYALDPGPGEPPRPLTFLWNGGPGANSVLVHLLGFGPMRIRTADTPVGPPGCDCVLEVNPGTWLESTDLVFVDPIGTGYSRPTHADYADEFYGVNEDAAYIAEFVRLFITRFDAWDSPLFIGGESYGTWRAAGVARSLEERGIEVAGVILISGGIPVGPVEEEEMRVAHMINARTAAAFYHQRLDGDLQQELLETLRQSEGWAATEYAPALANRAELSRSARDRIVEGLARYTGLDPADVDSEALVVNRQEFAEQLLGDQGVELARFDTRLTTSEAGSSTGARAVLVRRYLSEDLDFDIAAIYQGLEEGYRSVNDSGPAGPGARWKWNHMLSGEPPPARLTVGDGPPGSRPAWLREALELNAEIEVFVAAGVYDSLNSCSLNRHLVSRLPLELRDNFRLMCYPGGHMMYEDRSIRLRMKADVGAFIREASTLGTGGIGTSSDPPPTQSTGLPQSVPLTETADVPQEEVVTTRHSVQVQGRALAYSAHAGRLPILDNETGEARANVFFVSYSVEPEPGEPVRPVMFTWNGGPGSNAGLLHVTAMGPRRLDMDDVYATANPATMSTMVDNEGTWLGATDLVFVDPVGTGYSRPTRTEYGPEFYDTRGDIESLAEFIRVYRNTFGAWDAPIILAGESYGSLRAASVAASLQAKGIDVAGIVFISGSPGLGPTPQHLSAPLLLPSLTATALYHGKLNGGLESDPDEALSDVRGWALGIYADVMSRAESLGPAERATTARELADFTGLSVDLMQSLGLSVSGPAFSERLLESEGRVLGRYDARLSRPRKAEEGIFDPREDASLAPLENTVSGNAPAMIRYLRSDLGYESDLFYIGPFGGAWPPPEGFRGDWMSVRWNRSDGPSAPLLDAMAANPALRVLHASGLYDLVTPAGPPAYQIAQLDSELRRRFNVEVYEGGHSFYLDRTSRMAFMRDGAALIEVAVVAARARAPAR